MAAVLARAEDTSSLDDAIALYNAAHGNLDPARSEAAAFGTALLPDDDDGLKAI